jgi:hypothetical protein
MPVALHTSSFGEHEPLCEPKTSQIENTIHSGDSPVRAHPNLTSDNDRESVRLGPEMAFFNMVQGLILNVSLTYKGCALFFDLDRRTRPRVFILPGQALRSGRACSRGVRPTAVLWVRNTHEALAL